MTMRRSFRINWHLSAPLLVAAGLVACSSDSSGLPQPLDGSTDGGSIDGTPRIDGAIGPLGTGGTPGSLDAGNDAASGSGGRMIIDGGAAGRGGTAGATVLPGAGGVGRGGATGAAGMGGRARGSGGGGGTRPGGTGGSSTTRPDGGVDSGMDAAPPPDVPGDGPQPDRPEAIDGGEGCGDLDEPCCSSRTCNLPSLICESGGVGGGGTCVACGGAGEPCCEGDVCTAPNTSCTGGGRGGGTCR